jgi:nitrogen fixation protein FixH
MSMNGPRPSDVWIPRSIVAVFVLLFIVLGHLVYIALSTFNGTVTDHPYENGLAYNGEITAREKLSRSGIAPELIVTRLNERRLQVQLRLADRRRIDNARLRVIRPTQAGLDRHYAMSPNAEGASILIDLPAPGLWDLVAEAKVDGLAIQSVKRLVP